MWWYLASLAAHILVRKISIASDSRMAVLCIACAAHCYHVAVPQSPLHACPHLAHQTCRPQALVRSKHTLSNELAKLQTPSPPIKSETPMHHPRGPPTHQ